MESDVAIYDIETATSGRIDPNRDTLKIFGCYSYKTKKTYLLTNKSDIQKFIDSHRILVGFNNRDYDNVVLKKAGIDLEYKVIIDLMIVFKKRASQMKIKKGMLGDLLMRYSLDYITRMLDLVDDTSAKGDIDYNIFKKPSWTPDEIRMIKEYTERDIDITRKLFEWVSNYFEPFKTYIPEKDVRNKKHITTSIASFTYMALCYKLGVEATFASDKTHGAAFTGGYVAYPAGEKFEGNILLFDFSSLYPNLFIQGNLFGDKCTCCTQEEKWHGTGFLKVEGYYCKKKLSKLSQLFKDLFLLRKEYKLIFDPKEYTIKIILNTGYGVVANPIFEQLHNAIAASDCTWLGRQAIKYVRKRFREWGAINIMSDTDSVAIQLPEGKTKEDAIELSKEILKEIHAYLPFPW